MEDFKIDAFNKPKKVKKLTKEVEGNNLDEESLEPVVSSISNPVTKFAEQDIFGEDEVEEDTKVEDSWEKAINEEKPLWEDFGLERNMRAMYPKSQYQK